MPFPARQELVLAFSRPFLLLAVSRSFREDGGCYEKIDLGRSENLVGVGGLWLGRIRGVRCVGAAKAKMGSS
jgi:hypothetical protein